MQSSRILVTVITAAFVVFHWLSLAPAAPLDDLIAAANKEGTLNFYGPSSLKPDGAQAFAQALNKKYRSNITVNFIPSGSMTRDVGKVATQAATGAPPEWMSWSPPMLTMRVFGSASSTNPSATNRWAWRKN